MYTENLHLILRLCVNNAKATVISLKYLPSIICQILGAQAARRKTPLLFPFHTVLGYSQREAYAMSLFTICPRRSCNLLDTKQLNLLVNFNSYIHEHIIFPQCLFYLTRIKNIYISTKAGHEYGIVRSPSRFCSFIV